MNALMDSITVFNTMINYFFNLQLFNGVTLGSFIMIIGLVGAGITMITNYKGQG